MPAPRQPDIRLVVASYGEDLSWISPLGLPAAVYDSTGVRPGMIPVPNVAREAGQYRRHLVANDGRFGDWNIYVQGDPFAHCEDFADRMARRDFLRRHLTPLGRVQGYSAGHTHRHSVAADRFARETLGHVPDGCQWVLGAQFAVSGPALMRWPLPWWESLLSKVLAEKHRSPWAMERLWLYILSGISFRPD